MELTVNYQQSFCVVNVNSNYVCLHLLYFNDLIVHWIATTLFFQITSLVDDYRIRLLVIYNSQLIKVLDNFHTFRYTITTDCLLTAFCRVQ